MKLWWHKGDVIYARALRFYVKLSAMSLSSKEIGQVVASLQQQLVGGIVRKAISPLEKDRIALEVRQPGENTYLSLVTAAHMTHLCSSLQKPKNAKTPHPFVMLLRKYCEGQVVVAVRQLNDDRVVAIEFEAPGRSGKLVCELTSRHANLFWLDGDGVICGSFYPNRSFKRPLNPGTSYVAPEPRLDAVTTTRFDENSDVNTQVAALYRHIEADSRLAHERQVVGKALNIAIKRLKRLLKNLKADLSQADQSENLKQQAFLLQANLYQVKKGMASLDVFDFEGKSAVISLDATISPVANMEKMFKRSKRLGTAAAKIEERKTEATASLAQMRTLADGVADADFKALNQIRFRLKKRFPDLEQKTHKGFSGQQERLPFREFSIAQGKIARVGRSAKDNDTTTLRHAKGNDLWLHVRGRTGSHVVVPLGRGEDPSPEVLVDASLLAAHYSDAKNEQDVEITYTKKRYVQKPRGFPAGAVRLIQEKTFLLRVDEGRLKKLLSGT